MARICIPEIYVLEIMRATRLPPMKMGMLQVIYRFQSNAPYPRIMLYIMIDG